MLKTIQSEVRNNKKMLACLRIEGIGVINAFAILAIIGDIKRFATARKLASYIRINPSSKTILRSRRNTKLQKWGLQLLLRKGHRNIAVGAVARKLVHYIWHALNRRKPSEEELQQTPFKDKKSYQRYLCEQLKTMLLDDDIPLPHLL
ncbi:MAG: transposase [Akkermansia sp.]